MTIPEDINTAAGAVVTVGDALISVPGVVTKLRYNGGLQSAVRKADLHVYQDRLALGRFLVERAEDSLVVSEEMVQRVIHADGLIAGLNTGMPMSHPSFQVTKTAAVHGHPQAYAYLMIIAVIESILPLKSKYRAGFSVRQSLAAVCSDELGSLAIPFLDFCTEFERWSRSLRVNSEPIDEEKSSLIDHGVGFSLEPWMIPAVILGEPTALLVPASNETLYALAALQSVGLLNNVTTRTSGKGIYFPEAYKVSGPRPVARNSTTWGLEICDCGTQRVLHLPQAPSQAALWTSWIPEVLDDALDRLPMWCTEMITDKFWLFILLNVGVDIPCDCGECWQEKVSLIRAMQNLCSAAYSTECKAAEAVRQAVVAIGHTWMTSVGVTGISLPYEAHETLADIFVAARRCLLDTKSGYLGVITPWGPLLPHHEWAVTFGCINSRGGVITSALVGYDKNSWRGSGCRLFRSGPNAHTREVSAPPMPAKRIYADDATGVVRLVGIMEEETDEAIPHVNVIAIGKNNTVEFPLVPLTCSMNNVKCKHMAWETEIEDGSVCSAWDCASAQSDTVVLTHNNPTGRCLAVLIMEHSGASYYLQSSECLRCAKEHAGPMPIVDGIKGECLAMSGTEHPVVNAATHATTQRTHVQYNEVG
ncbi:hypothetical protein VKS41_008471 [Umbelopsis sp. WA50703]